MMKEKSPKIERPEIDEELVEFGKKNFTLVDLTLEVSSGLRLLAACLNKAKINTKIDSMYHTEIVNHYNSFQTMALQALQRVNKEVEDGFKRMKEGGDGANTTGTTEEIKTEEGTDTTAT